MANHWQMKFNVAKCHSMRVTRSESYSASALQTKSLELFQSFLVKGIIKEILFVMLMTSNSLTEFFAD